MKLFILTIGLLFSYPAFATVYMCKFDGQPYGSMEGCQTDVNAGCLPQDCQAVEGWDPGFMKKSGQDIVLDTSKKAQDDTAKAAKKALKDGYATKIAAGTATPEEVMLYLTDRDKLK